MFKLLLALSVVLSGSVLAQNMAESEDYRTAYVDMPDGSSRYIGKCSTHEDYQKFYYKTKRTVLKYTEPSDLPEAEIEAMLAKFDKKLLAQVLTTFDMYDVSNGSSVVKIFKDYIDDITVERITNVVFPNLDLIRFSVGVGGGNGGYVVYNQVKNGAVVSYEKMSYTFDSNLNFCDKKVWLQNTK